MFGTLRISATSSTSSTSSSLSSLSFSSSCLVTRRSCRIFKRPRFVERHQILRVLYSSSAQEEYPRYNHYHYHHYHSFLTLQQQQQQHNKHHHLLWLPHDTRQRNLAVIQVRYGSTNGDGGDRDSIKRNIDHYNKSCNQNDTVSDDAPTTATTTTTTSLLEDQQQQQQQSSVWVQLRSLPNMITLARMASTPLLCYWIVQEHYTLAISGCVVAAISDAVDGYLAKHHGGSTVLGTYLDPLADKVLINGLAISLWYANILPTPLIVLWATKDVLLLSGTAWYLQQQQRTINFLSNSIATKPLTVTPSLLGKVNTGLQFTTLFVGIVTPVVSSTAMPPIVLQSLCYVTGATTIGSVLSYSGGAGVKLITTSTNDDTKKAGEQKSQNEIEER
ncbi:CDP-alcohol phosphatidyltransferase [Nitzschia inconspicua]|uniref:CDP-alcohol phosphatidyltransferase n=1 Tax=Nitzschia inconspicua TaxID=303405 RepID=A0A9K3KY56_9STRA|nr:CDP-alcohol phosphatidyltransferase [Nitzschia inconspicua]